MLVDRLICTSHQASSTVVVNVRGQAVAASTGLMTKTLDKQIYDPEQVGWRHHTTPIHPYLQTM